LALPQVDRGRTRGGAFRSGGEHHGPRHPHREAGTNWCTGPTAPPLRGAVQAAGTREGSIAGGTGSAMQPILGLSVRPSTQNTMVESADEVSQESQGSGGNASNTRHSLALTGPTSRGQTPSASLRAHRHALLTFWQRFPPMPRQSCGQHLSWSRLSRGMHAWRHHRACSACA
jgi:hypothetical protein